MNREDAAEHPEGVDQWRQALAESGALWTSGGLFDASAGWCAAFSGAPVVDFNTVFCWGDDAANLCTRAVTEVQKAAVPALAFVAGPALGGVQIFADAKWICIGQAPMMLFALEDLRSEPEHAVRLLSPDDFEDAWVIGGDAHRLPASVAAISLPARSDDPHVGIWGLYEDGTLRSVMATYRTGGGVGVWSVATARANHGRGYGRRLTCSVLWHLRAAGATHAVLLSSVEGGPLYRNLGFRTIDNWQMWSRPRWVLGRV